MLYKKRTVGQSICAVCLRLLPKRTLTAWAGALLRSPISRMAIPGFAALYRISLDDCEEHWTTYPTLAAFFARRLTPGLRTLSTNDSSVISSPVDGVVSEMGFITEGQIITAKGYGYTVEALLANRSDAFTGGQFVTLYLSPRDYHRIHIPLSGTLDQAVHIPGTLFPVNRLGTQSIAGLYTRNERVVCTLSTAKMRQLVLALVGSFVVGSVRLAPQFKAMQPTNRGKGAQTALLAQPSTVSHGEELGWFEFGSTVVMLFASGQAELTIRPGDRLQALQPIGKWLA